MIFTVIGSLSKDGRDRSLDYKISLFNSTTFDYVLKNIGIGQIIVTEFLTDQCVDHTIRDGADRGYLMICAEDGCATESRKRHEQALAAFGGYCRITTVKDLIAEMG